MAGWFAGAVQVVAEQPFDVVKVRLQSRAISFVAEPGALSLARSTFLREGAGAFLQGITPRLLTYSAVKASLFALYERLRAAGAGPPWCAGALAGALNRSSRAQGVPSRSCRCRRARRVPRPPSPRARCSPPPAACAPLPAGRRSSAHTRHAGARARAARAGRVRGGAARGPARVTRVISTHLLARSLVRRYGLFSVFHHGPERAAGSADVGIGGCAGVTFYLSTRRSIASRPS